MPHFPRKHSVRNQLVVTGIRENNLKNLDLTVTHDTFTVVSGVSGSGKSTLAFDTIYAEGGRRYVETFSPYTRQFLDRLHRPDIDSITGVRPALALEQRNRVTSSRSTVGTVTEINDFLKVIWANLATPYCVNCDIPIERNSPQQVSDELVSELEPSAEQVLLVCFEVTFQGKVTADAIRYALKLQGHSRLVDSRKQKGESGKVLNLDDLEEKELLALAKKPLSIVVDRIRKTSDESPETLRDRIRGSIRQAYLFGHGSGMSYVLSPDMRSIESSKRFSEQLRCNRCSSTLPAPKPSHFTFNSALGACDECHGFGKVLSLDPELCVPDPQKSIDEGAVAAWSTPSTAPFFKKLKAYCKEESIDTGCPWSKLPKRTRDTILLGSKEFKGVAGWFERLQRKRHKMHVRVLLSRYRSEFICPKCSGSRLQPIALQYRLLEQTLPAIWNLSITSALRFVDRLIDEGKADEFTEYAVLEAQSRLKYLSDIGLEYLSLDRQSRTLSGGETQRVNLTTILGSRLVNTTLVLDEPTIGLHSRDTGRLLNALDELRNRGNTLLVVEHDPAVIAHAEEVIDLGPGAGASGGKIVYQGPVRGLIDCAESKTGAYLRKQQATVPKLAKTTPDVRGEKRKQTQKTIDIVGARAHNLKRIDVSIPLNSFVAVTGPSGSGKSTLLTQCLYGTYQKLRFGMSAKQLRESDHSLVTALTGLDQVDQIELIDQSPIGKSPRSNPATYSKAWDLIRECLADTEGATRLGLSKSAFSFNVDGGRCPVCSGAGQIKVEMQFLADVYVECEACRGARFQDQVLSVRFAGRNVLELLQLSLEETVALFASLVGDDRYKKIETLLRPFIELGLGYLRLGHPLNAVSGGEAQRIKLASYLAPGSSTNCLFILDEPTTGLHPSNIEDLLKTFRTLVSYGHSLLCIEHNLDVISAADWIIDLGPEGGDAGGQLAAAATPAEIAANPDAYPLSATAGFLADHISGATKLRNPPVSLPVRRNSAADEPQSIQVVHARHHNLKNISIDIPQHKLIAVTGVSGSGKSTLAFDIVFAEGQRRYIDCLSPYARQFIKQLSVADVEQLTNIPPTIAVSQKTAPPMGISTVATTTELYQYLRLMFSKLGTQHCIHDNTPITSRSVDAIVAEIGRRFQKQRVFLFAPVVSGRKGHYNELFNRALAADISQARIDGKLVSLSADLRVERHKLHWISLAVASLSKGSANSPLLREAINQCLLLGNGVVEVFADSVKGEPLLFSIDRVCPKCGTGYRELDPQDFSFRSLRGMCETCGGRGAVEAKRGSRTMTQCPECRGSRLGPIGRHVYLHGETIHDLCNKTAPQLLAFLKQLDLGSRLDVVVQPILRELFARLELMTSVGLDYLSLDRDASSLSGGEAQRLRLAKTLGSPLTGVCYVLDEPSIGLHPQDHSRLMETLVQLRDAGNTVLIVEHDEQTIRAADYCIDIGPRGGANGGEVVFTGSVEGLQECSRSLTGRALAERSGSSDLNQVNQTKADKSWSYIELTGAHANNLQNVSVKIPLQKLTTVVGVSGAGKSSLIHGSLVPAFVEAFEGAKERNKLYDQTWKALSFSGPLQRLIEIDQSPVGKTSTSAPVSFLGAFDEIRKVYAQLPEARSRGWAANHFSFNTGAGRCPACNGRGEIVVPMSFLPNAATRCETCNGLRYSDDTLLCTYQGFSIGELLKKTFSEAAEIFANHRKIRQSFDYVLALGLGYLSLGQPTHTLSGGEAQRLKIARELSAREAKDTLYILDEPTIGLHMTDVEKLIAVLKQLIEKGNTVVLIEHDLDVMRAADYLIEVGPGPGAAGGKLLFMGTPLEFLNSSVPTPTKKFLSSGQKPSEIAVRTARESKPRKRTAQG